MNLTITRRIRPYQRKLHEYLINTIGGRAFENAHRRWGKDEVALDVTCQTANLIGQIPNARVGSYWHCLPEYAQGRKAIWTAVNANTGKRRIDEMFPHELRENTNEQEMFIRFKSGSTWQVIGSDRYDTTVGAGPVGIVYSEWALANPSAWAYHRPMLEENNGWACFITTPRGRNHAKTMYDMAVKSPRWFAETSTVYDTQALTPEQIEEAKNEYIALYGEDLGNAQFEQEYLCSFNAAVMGAFYAKEMLAIRNEGRIQKLEVDPAIPIHTAWDLGVSDTTAIWVFQVLHGGIHVLDHYETSGVGAEHYCEWLNERGYKGGNDYVPHDAENQEWGSGRKRVDVLRDFNRKPRRVASVSVQDGIQAARKTLPIAKFDFKCEERGIAALEQYRREWDDKNKVFRLKPKHDWASNSADAWRYLSLAWQEYQPPAPKPQHTPDDYITAEDEDMDGDSWRI